VVRLEVGAVAHGGHCVARHEGRVVFVRHTLPGETVLARLTEAGETAKFWRADAVQILTASPDRVPAPCPLSGPGRCGGCDWQHVTQPAQRRLKAAVVEEHLRHQLPLLAHPDPTRHSEPSESSDASKFADFGVVVEEVPGSADGLGWRSRVRFAVNGRGRAGLREHRSHHLVEVEECLIADPRITETQVGLQRWPGAEAVDVIAPAHGDPLVVVEPAAAASAKGAKTAEPTGARTAQTRRAKSGATKTAQARAKGSSLRLPKLPAGTALSTRDDDGLHQVRGRTWVSEQVLVDGVPQPFRVTGTGFWQVHPGAAQTLLDAVLAAADPQPGERALDLYGGVGLFSAGLAARVGPGGSVTLVEGDGRATADARRSLHELGQVRVETAVVHRALPGLRAQGADVVVLDPPRSGAGKAVVTAIAALRPRVIVYVACDPAALARDLAIATDAGYRLIGLRAFDLFPMTHHVECVATLVPATRPAQLS
jgi:tRNA/tmRNA/rRNA uracil-C5-methylase (TrmA/RlmC/RlmD family)